MKKHPLAGIIASAAFAFMTPVAAFAGPPKSEANASKSPLAILMSDSQRILTGVESLSDSQREELDKWLLKNLAAAYNEGKTAAPACPPPSCPPSLDGFESQVDGEFQGWSGETTVVLRNGQIWRQASYSYSYHYAFAPRVWVFPIQGAPHMLVEDMDEPVPVKRLH